MNGNDGCSVFVNVLGCLRSFMRCDLFGCLSANVFDAVRMPAIVVLVETCRMSRNYNGLDLCAKSMYEGSDVFIFNGVASPIWQEE